MKNKILSIFLSLAVIMVGVAFIGADRAEAQTASFPAGCSSGLGYSVTTGNPCNGKINASSNPMPGCNSAFGYSITNGAPCSGTSTAIFSMAGCSSMYGYSVIDARACNGTNVAISAPTFPTTPGGFPRTGEGSPMGVLATLAGSGLAAIFGSVYLSRKYRFS